MFEFHQDRHAYFEIQVQNSKESVIPFLETCFTLPPGSKIMEIGCGEGGVLKAFIEKGHTGLGVEMDENRVINGQEWMKDEIKAGKMRFITDDIFKYFPTGSSELYHLIILKDVIEHIGDKETLLKELKRFLHPDGAIFFGFPPWQMPFGGHQQMCTNKTLSRMPWLHLLPRFLYRKILTRYKEPVKDLMEIVDTRISIEGFERLAKSGNFRIIGKKHFLIAPIYKYKFGLKERKQLWLIRHIPYFRNLFTTAVYYVIAPNK